MDTVKNIGSILGYIISLLTLITLIKTKFLGLLDGRIKKESGSDDINTRVGNIESMLDQLVKNEGQFKKDVNESLRRQDEACKQMMANIIETTYFANRAKRQLSTIELKRVISAYAVYHELHGNSYITEIYEEMLTWERVD